MAPVVVVGLRPGALDAAERLGRPVVAVVEAAPGPRALDRLADVVVSPFDGPSADWGGVARALARHRPAAVVALTERSVGLAAHVRAALGMPGVSPEVAHACTDKRAMKRAVRAAGLSCADVVEAGEGLTGEAIGERLGLPVVVKSALGSGGRGTRLVRDAAGLPAALAPDELAESFVEGVEMSVELLLADGEVVFWNPTQYLEPAWSSLAPAPLAPDVRASVRALSEAAAAALGVAWGMTHLELFLTADGPVFGEMAVRPPGGHLMRLMALAYGFDPWEAVLRVALGEAPDLPARAERVAAVRILHPGAGTVSVVDGVEAARAIAGVEEVSVRVRPGDVLGVREGTGQEAAHVIVTGADAAEAERRLAAAVARIRVEVEG